MRRTPGIRSERRAVRRGLRCAAAGPVGPLGVLGGEQVPDPLGGVDDVVEPVQRHEAAGQPGQRPGREAAGPGAFEKARAELDRKSGHVTIWATEIDDDGAPIGEFEDTPAGFGRIAASTACSASWLQGAERPT